MKRYFTFETPPDAATYRPQGGQYHYMSLPAGGYVCVTEGCADVPSDWVELPHLLESTAANFNGINTTAGEYVAPAVAAGEAAPETPAAIAGITTADTTFRVAKKLAAINKLFHP